MQKPEALLQTKLQLEASFNDKPPWIFRKYSTELTSGETSNNGRSLLHHDASIPHPNHLNYDDTHYEPLLIYYRL